MKILILILSLIVISGCRNSSLFYTKVEHTYTIQQASKYQYAFDNNDVEDIPLIPQSAMHSNTKYIDNNQVVEFNDQKKIYLKAKKQSE